ncbi:MULTISPECIES: exonuclease domain-containing protein [unclassified Halomonas]|uniref:3'-5' exonuclease n=1 Tax=unclassified Halomonas TaxID=2609666 RepID=UPI002076A409|nr:MULTISPECIES: exonuclease domain-containing protein [unclassified Halomonas]
MPAHQRLVGLWLALGGLSLLGGVLFAVWLESRLILDSWERGLLWTGALSGGVTLLTMGVLLQRYLLRPLRMLHEEFAKLLAAPDAPVSPPGGWLESLAPDIRQIAAGWREDRARLEGAREEGQQAAQYTRRALETLLQHLATPLMLFDRHRRLLLFNHAAEAFFDSPCRLGLGKRLETLLAAPSLVTRFDSLSDSAVDTTFAREALVGLDERILSLSLSRLPGDSGEILITLRDVTHFWERTVGEQDHLPSPSAGERLSSIWSNAFWQALDEQLDPSQALITPIGVPGWFKGHAASLVALFEILIIQLHGRLAQRRFEGALVTNEDGVWLAFIWRGEPIDAATLSHWHQLKVESLPLVPRVEQILALHESSLWSEPEPGGEYARLCVSLPHSRRQGAPVPASAPRPEFHDFEIARLAPPEEPLAERSLEALELVAFDTETTGLDLRGGDTLLSVGACRIVNRRLLASDVFDSLITPGRRIPPASTAIHGIGDADVQDAPALATVLERFRRYRGDAVLLAHNASFDLLALSQAGERVNNPVLDTLLISKALDGALLNHDLDTLIQRYAITDTSIKRHTALGDAQLTARVWLALLPRLKARHVKTLKALLALQTSALDDRDGSK